MSEPKVDLHETPGWKRMVARVDAEVEAEGGGTGSNMAEPPWIPPETRERWAKMSEEERQKRTEEILGSIEKL